MSVNVERQAALAIAEAAADGRKPVQASDGDIAERFVEMAETIARTMATAGDCEVSADGLRIAAKELRRVAWAALSMSAAMTIEAMRAAETPKN